MGQNRFRSGAEAVSQHPGDQGSNPCWSTMVAEAKVVEALVCGTSNSRFESGRSPHLMGKVTLTA